MTKILDSTLRDGLYAFGKSMQLAYFSKVAKYLDTVVDYLEVGSAISFGYGDSDSFNEDMKRLECVNKILKSTKSVIFVQPQLLDNIKNWFKEIKNIKPDLIRIGIDPELDNFLLDEIVNSCEDERIPFTINLMKAYRYSDIQLEKIFKIANKSNNCDYISVVDSSGCMSPSEVFEITNKIFRNASTNVGLHIHDNSGYANSISLMGLDQGLCVDSTLLGKGRMGGNADTVLLVLHRSIKKANNLEEIDYLINRLISATTIIWGVEARDYIVSVLIGLTGLHSSKLKTYDMSKLDFIPSLTSMISKAWYKN